MNLPYSNTIKLLAAARAYLRLHAPFACLVRYISDSFVMPCMAATAKSFEIINAVIMSILIPMVDIKATSRTAAFAGIFAKFAVSLDAIYPHWITFAGMVVLSAYRRIVALSRAMAANVFAPLWDFVGFPAMLACEHNSVFISPANFFAVRAVTAEDRTELFLSTRENLTAGTFHAVIIPVAAT